MVTNELLRPGSNDHHNTKRSYRSNRDLINSLYSAAAIQKQYINSHCKVIESIR